MTRTPFDLIQQEEQQLMVQLSQAYLEWEQRTRQQGIEQGIQQGIERGIERGERAIVLRQLTRKIGILPETIAAQVENLSILQLENLGEALLYFGTLADLEVWLTHQN
jgi:predicted transposase YdaD